MSIRIASVGVARLSKRVRSRSESTATDESVYVPYASGKVVAIGIADGQERWRAGSRAIRFDWPPALTDDRIFLTSEDGLYVLPKSIR